METLFWGSLKEYCLSDNRSFQDIQLQTGSGRIFFLGKAYLIGSHLGKMKNKGLTEMEFGYRKYLLAF